MNLDQLESVRQANLTGKDVFCRLDFDVPLTAAGQPRDSYRIRICLPTINYLQQAGARKIVLAWKLDRPEQQEERLRTDKTAAKASEILGQEIEKVDGWNQEQVASTSSRLVALENLRFHPGEQAPNEAEKEQFASQMAELADIYVNDSFACSHRKDASIYNLPHYLPSYMGLNVEKELSTIEKLREPERPLVVVLGGKKQEKLAAIADLIGEADKILVGGVPANTLLQAKGYDLNSSLVNEANLPQAKELLTQINAASMGEKLLLPEDLLVADSQGEVERVAVNQIPRGYQAFDVGQTTISKFCKEIESAATVVWSGALGKFESEKFEQGTERVAHSIANSSAFTVAGGGETSLALKEFGCFDDCDFVSSGGGAFLQLFTGHELPGLRAMIE